MKLLYPYGSDPAEQHFVADNLHTGRKIVTIADSKVKQRKCNEIDYHTKKYPAIKQYKAIDSEQFKNTLQVLEGYL